MQKYFQDDLVCVLFYFFHFNIIFHFKIKINFIFHKISWRLLINGILKKSNKQLKDNDTLTIFSLNYVDALCSIFQEYLTDPTKLKFILFYFKQILFKTRILKMDIQWAVISSLISFGSKELMNAKNKLNKDMFGNYNRNYLIKY